MFHMRTVILTLIFGMVLRAQSQPARPQTLRGVLLEQLHTTHDEEDWFVPITVAVADLTPGSGKLDGRTR